jgi:hypothetical protein
MWEKGGQQKREEGIWPGVVDIIKGENRLVGPFLFSLQGLSAIFGPRLNFMREL